VMNKKLIWILVLLLVILAGARLSFVKQNFGGFLRSGSEIFIGQTKVLVSIADTQPERERGLSGVPSLPQNAGKLFIFQAPESPGFWMKEMRFPIDIIWIAQDMKVVGINQNLAPETYPEVFTPPQAIQYVLEVPAGFAQANEIKIGDILHLEK
jgi:uncharacterized protein